MNFTDNWERARAKPRSEKVKRIETDELFKLVETHFRIKDSSDAEWYNELNQRIDKRIKEILEPTDEERLIDIVSEAVKSAEAKS